MIISICYEDQRGNICENLLQSFGKYQCYAITKRQLLILRVNVFGDVFFLKLSELVSYAVSPPTNQSGWVLLDCGYVFRSFCLLVGLELSWRLQEEGEGLPLAQQNHWGHLECTEGWTES